MVSRTELIILNYTKLGDNSLVIHTLSQEHGRRGFMVNVGKKASMSLFQPLSILEAEVIENPKSSLWKLRNISIKHPLLGIRSNLYKNTMTMFMSEVLYRTIKDGANEAGLFEWCERSLLQLDAIQSDFSNFHLRFLLELAMVMGFSPTADDISSFAGEYSEIISVFVKSPFAESMLIPMTGEMRNNIADILLRYISHHSESAINIQSLKILRELYS